LRSHHARSAWIDAAGALRNQSVIPQCRVSSQRKSTNWAKVDTWSSTDAPISAHCAPEIAAGRRHPGDLAHHTLLRSYRSDEWSRWFAEIGVPCPPVTGPALDSSLAIAELASQGLGIALLPLPMFAAQIEAGKLAQPFGTTVFTGRYYLTCPSDRVQNSAMIAFLNWIRSEGAVCAHTRGQGSGVSPEFGSRKLRGNLVRLRSLAGYKSPSHGRDSTNSVGDPPTIERSPQALHQSAAHVIILLRSRLGD
jgi:hypothetical protein